MRIQILAAFAAATLIVGCAPTDSVETAENVQRVEYDTINGVSTGTWLRVDTFESEFIVDRPLDIWLPSNYDAKRKHAVLYMFDAQMLFDANQTWNGQEWRVDEIVDSLVSTKSILPTIVVALHNGGMMRNFEYFPQKPFNTLQKQFSDSVMAAVAVQYGSDSTFPVQSDAYLKYLIQEVEPAIQQRFNVYTDPSTRVVMGSSMGGLMSMYAIGEYPEFFGTALCLSTHWPGGFKPNEQMPNAFAEYVANNIKTDRVGKIYFDYGTETLDGMYEPFQLRVDSALASNGFVQGNNWTTKKFPGAAHDEKSWAKRLHIPLKFALSKQR